MNKFPMEQSPQYHKLFNKRMKYRRKLHKCYKLHNTKFKKRDKIFVFVELFFFMHKKNEKNNFFFASLMSFVYYIICIMNSHSMQMKGWKKRVNNYFVFSNLLCMHLVCYCKYHYNIPATSLIYSRWVFTLLFTNVWRKKKSYEARKNNTMSWLHYYNLYVVCFFLSLSFFFLQLESCNTVIKVFI